MATERRPVAVCTERHGSLSRRLKRRKNTIKLLFYKKNKFVFYPLFVCIICVGIFILRFLVPCRAFAFLAGLQGANESISGKHVDFCFHGDPEGLTMSPRLRPTGWWKTLLPFSLFYSHFVPPFVLSSLLITLYFFKTFLFCLFAVNICCFASFEANLQLRVSAAFLALFLTFSILLAAFLPLLSSACEEL